MAAEGGRPSKPPSLPKDQPIGSVETTSVPGWNTTATELAVPNLVTQLARGAITAADTLTIELVEADETPGRGDHPMTSEGDRATCCLSGMYFGFDMAQPERRYDVTPVTGRSTSSFKQTLHRGSGCARELDPATGSERWS